MLRVIAGTAKGRRLQGPPEPRRKPARPGVSRTITLSETRPTSDLIRGVIFDILDAMETDYDRVLDLYAGTGALGIEALSRGDGTADFVDRDAGAISVIKANLRTCSFEDRASVHLLTTERAAIRLADSGPYTLILADPPYYDEGASAAVEAIASSALVGPETVLAYEHHRRLEVLKTMGTLRLQKSRRHGDTVVSIYAGEDPS
jgi:16S rRNA (guanine(966)-N(2))-methyltransferase RsmD